MNSSDAGSYTPTTFTRQRTHITLEFVATLKTSEFAIWKACHAILNASTQGCLTTEEVHNGIITWYRDIKCARNSLAHALSRSKDFEQVYIDGKLPGRWFLTGKTNGIERIIMNGSYTPTEFDRCRTPITLEYMRSLKPCEFAIWKACHAVLNASTEGCLSTDEIHNEIANYFPEKKFVRNTLSNNLSQSKDFEQVFLDGKTPGRWYLTGETKGVKGIAKLATKPGETVGISSATGDDDDDVAADGDASPVVDAPLPYEGGLEVSWSSTSIFPPANSSGVLSPPTSSARGANRPGAVGRYTRRFQPYPVIRYSSGNTSLDSGSSGSGSSVGEPSLRRVSLSDDYVAPTSAPMNSLPWLDGKFCDPPGTYGPPIPNSPLSDDIYSMLIAPDSTQAAPSTSMLGPSYPNPAGLCHPDLANLEGLQAGIVDSQHFLSSYTGTRAEQPQQEDLVPKHAAHGFAGETRSENALDQQAMHALLTHPNPIFGSQPLSVGEPSRSRIGANYSFPVGYRRSIPSASGQALYGGVNENGDLRSPSDASLPSDPMNLILSNQNLHDEFLSFLFESSTLNEPSIQSSFSSDDAHSLLAAPGLNVATSSTSIRGPSRPSPTGRHYSDPVSLGGLWAGTVDSQNPAWSYTGTPQPPRQEDPVQGYPFSGPRCKTL